MLEILETRCQPRKLSLALIGARRHVDGGGERGLEFLEAAAITADLRELIEAALGILDLIARRKIDRRIEGDVDHILADIDQLAPDREIVDCAAIIHRVDDGRRLGGEPGEVLGKRQSGDVGLSGQEGLQRHRRCQLAGANETARDVVDLLMNRLEEMLRLEKIADAIERLVVDQNRAQEGLLGLDIVRCGAVGRRRLPWLFA